MYAGHSTGSILCQHHGLPVSPEPVFQVSGQSCGNGVRVARIVVPRVVAVGGYHIHELSLQAAHAHKIVRARCLGDSNFTIRIAFILFNYSYREVTSAFT